MAGTATRIALTLVALTLVGCGRPALVAPALPRAASTFAGLADFPGISDQIERAKIGLTERGTQVRALPRPAQAKGTTFLAYKALDNNLGLTLDQHLNILERAGSSEQVNALAFVDDIGPGNTSRYYLRQDQQPETITSPYTPVGERNMAAPKTLTEAVRWAFDSYPSQGRWLDINSHGGGYKGISQDDHSDGVMPLAKLASAIQAGTQGRALDVLSFDACLMASVEVAYELRGTAKVMVASEDSSYALGMNYDQSLAVLAKGPLAPAQLARHLVLRAARRGDNKAFYTVSAIDLSRADALARSVDQLAGALLAAMPAHKAAILRAFQGSPAFSVAGPDRSDFDHRDLYDLTEQLRHRVPDAGVQQACAGVKDALYGRERAVIMAMSAAEEREVTRGVSIYAPTNRVDAEYRTNAFAKATRWDEFLSALTSR